MYKGVEIIGYAHIQLWSESRAAIRIIVIDESQQRQGFGTQFLDWIEAWLKSKNYHSIHTESFPNPVHFYKHLGYIAMDFNDPDGGKTNTCDTPIGKLLM